MGQTPAKLFIIDNSECKIGMFLDFSFSKTFRYI